MPRLLLIPLTVLAVVPLACARRAAQETSDQPTAPVVVVQPPTPQPPRPRPDPNAGPRAVAPMPHAPGERLALAGRPVAPMPHLPGEPAEKDLTNPDPGLETMIEAALPELARELEKAVAEKVVPDPVPQPIDVPPPPPPPPNTDVTGGAFAPPAPWETNSWVGPTPGAFPGRNGAVKDKLVKAGGGNADSERAVALGLAWLTQQQKKDGSWEFDAGEFKKEQACATALGLLPFLGAGETHKPGKDGKATKYQKTVDAALKFLMKACPLNGANAGRLSASMYAQGIATLALVEAYGMTKDPALRPYAQAAINCIQKSQGPNGSWGYAANQNGDTSIVGWQLQALQAAKLTKDLVVDKKVIERALKFLDSVAKGNLKAEYGYSSNAGAAAGTALTASGLLDRYYLDGWGPNHPGLAEGVKGLMKTPPPARGGLQNMYYFYYATQVVHFYEGEEWVTWNEGPKGADGTRKGGMRDWLVSSQVKNGADKIGSWDPEAGFFGSGTGRLGTTAVALLTLEVYYRHLPLYKRGADGGLKIDDKK